MPDSPAGQGEDQPVVAQEDVKQPAAEDVADKPAAPSDAGDKDDGPKSILDAVTAALDKTKGEGSSPSDDADRSEAKESAGDKPDDETAELGEPTDEELAGYHSKTRRRVKWLLDQRNEAKAELDRLKPSVDGWTGLQGYMRDTNLSVDEVNEGFEAMRLMKNDPLKALPVLKGYVQRLEQLAGENLSPEMQQAVEAGEISEQHARELSRAKSSASLASAQSAQAAERARQLAANQGFERHAADVSRVVNEWDSQQATSDPDYALKRSRVMERVKLALYEEGYPRTTQAAVDLVSKIKKDVDEEFKKLSPKREQIKPITAAGSAPARPEPKTMLDVVRQAAAGT
jgi:hypothetical protein